MEQEVSFVDLHRLIGHSTPTVRRALHILQSCGLVEYATPRAKVRLLGDDVQAELDAWTQWMGVDRRGERRRARHISERDEHAQKLSMRDGARTQWRAKWPKLAQRTATTARTAIQVRADARQVRDH